MKDKVFMYKMNKKNISKKILDFAKEI
ncbi:MAG: hypothetical protein ACD_5C00347G0012, partial [uncultured bacterium]